MKFSLHLQRELDCKLFVCHLKLIWPAGDGPAIWLSAEALMDSGHEISSLARMFVERLAALRKASACEHDHGAHA